MKGGTTPDAIGTHPRRRDSARATGAIERAVDTETAMVEFKGKVDTTYLDRVKAAVRRDKEHSYDLLDLAPGASVLDVGCGPATDTLALAALVTPGGRVVGVDFDPAMIAAAEGRARDAGLAGTVTHLAADAMALPFPDGAFDACHAERIFQHLSDPAGTLAEMIRVTRPGGRIVVFDTDQLCRMLDTPEQDVWQRLTRYNHERRITSPLVALQLFRMFREAGLQDVTAEPRAIAVSDLSFIRLAAGLDVLEAEAMAAGVVTADEVARLRASMEADAAGGTLFGYWTMILAAGTKPAA